jgi:hypothetical protein
MKSIFKEYQLKFGEYEFNGFKFIIDKQFNNKKDCNVWFDSRFDGGTEKDRLEVIEKVTSYLNDKFHVFVSWLCISKKMPFLHIIMSILLYKFIILSLIILLTGSIWFLVKKIIQEKLKTIQYSIESGSDLKDFEFFFTPDGREYLKQIEDNKNKKTS